MNGFLIYLKNGKLHREAGPAIFRFQEKDKYSYEKDKNLYKNETKKIDAITKIRILANVGDINNKKGVSYYLEGKYYSKKEFDIFTFNKELTEELSINKANHKKIKI
jgi:hypothetical protein